MKHKKILLIALTVILVLLLCHCATDSLSGYKLRQDANQITKIEIVYQNPPIRAPGIFLTPRKEIEPGDYEAFLADLQAVEGNDFTPPFTIYGPFLFRITYADGAKELIGVYNNGYMDPDGELCDDLFYFWDEEGFYAVVQKYLGEDITEEVEAWEEANN